MQYSFAVRQRIINIQLKFYLLFSAIVVSSFCFGFLYEKIWGGKTPESENNVEMQSSVGQLIESLKGIGFQKIMKALQGDALQGNALQANGLQGNDLQRNGTNNTFLDNFLNNIFVLILSAEYEKMKNRQNVTIGQNATFGQNATLGQNVMMEDVVPLKRVKRDELDEMFEVEDGKFPKETPTRNDDSNSNDGYQEGGDSKDKENGGDEKMDAVGKENVDGENEEEKGDEEEESDGNIKKNHCCLKILTPSHTPFLNN